MHFKAQLLLILCCVGLISCYKTIEVDLPDTEIKPVVNCLFSPDEPFLVYVSQTKSPTDTNSYVIKNAEVLIGGEGISPKLLPHTGIGFYSDKQFFPEKGIEYYIKVKVPGYEEVSARGKIPETETRISSVELKPGFITEPVTGMGEEARIPVHNIRVKILEDKAISDYMAFSVVYRYISRGYNFENEIFTETPRNRFGYLNSDDPIIRNEGLELFDEHDILIFRDVLFVIQPETVRFNFQKDEEIKIWLRFYQFSPEAFNYTKSWIIHDYTSWYDFWEAYEPLPLYSNIENGYGIFAGYSKQQYKIFPDSTLVYYEP